MNAKSSKPKGTPVSTDALREKLRTRLNLEVSSGDTAQASPGHEFLTISRLKVMDIVPFEHNPRHASNPEFESIKASIASTGIEQTLHVTRRPNSTTWILAKGGKTRLTAIQALFAEEEEHIKAASAAGQPKTPNRYAEIDVLVNPYPGEVTLMAWHVTENDARSEMCFWDTARAFKRIKDLLEQQDARTYTGRDLEDVMGKHGLKFKRNMLDLFTYALENLTPLGDDVLFQIRSSHINETIRPCIIELSRLYAKFALPDFKENLLVPAFRELAYSYAARIDQGSFNVREIVDALHRLFAELSHISNEQLVVVLANMKISPETATLEELMPPPPPPAPTSETQHGELVLPVLPVAVPAQGAMKGLHPTPTPTFALSAKPLQISSEGQRQQVTVAKNQPPKEIKRLTGESAGNTGSQALDEIHIDDLTKRGGWDQHAEDLRYEEELLYEESLHPSIKSQEWQDFEEAARELLDESGLDANLYQTESRLPAGFSISLPTVEERVNGDDRYWARCVWWLLSHMSGILSSTESREAAATLLDDNETSDSLRQACTSDAEWTLAQEQLIGEEMSATECAGALFWALFPRVTGFGVGNSLTKLIYMWQPLTKLPPPNGVAWPQQFDLQIGFASAVALGGNSHA
jgi:ParB family protein of integrating conjugative element (PFGI_1 class)